MSGFLCGIKILSTFFTCNYFTNDFSQFLWKKNSWTAFETIQCCLGSKNTRLTQHLIARDIGSSDSKRRIRVAVIPIDRQLPIVNTPRETDTRKYNAMLVAFARNAHCILGYRHFLRNSGSTDRPREPSNWGNIKIAGINKKQGNTSIWRITKLPVFRTFFHRL